MINFRLKICLSQTKRSEGKERSISKNIEEIKNLFKKIEFLIGYSLPDEFKKLYLKTPKINNLELMDLTDIYNEIVNSNDEEKDVELYEIEPENSILAKSFDK